MNSVRGYRYAIRPKGQQVERIRRLAWAARRTWNALVWCQTMALRRMARGEELAVLREWGDMLKDKKLAGMACHGFAHMTQEEKAAAVAAKRRQTIGKFYRGLFDQEATADEILVKRRAEEAREGKAPPEDLVKERAQLVAYLLRKERRMLATYFALERVRLLYAARSLPLGGKGVRAAAKGKEGVRLNGKGTRMQIMSAVHNALLAKFEDASEVWAKNKRESPPRRKGPRHPVALQVQVHKKNNPVQNSWPFTLTKNDKGRVIARPVQPAQKISPSREVYADIASMHPVLERLEIVYHRALPPRGTIKQVALAITSRRSFLAYSIEQPVDDTVWNPPACPGIVAGIDPGVTPPATWAFYTSGSAPEQKGKKDEVPVLGHWYDLEPDIKRTVTLLAKYRRLQRCFDRQDRDANPECYLPDGTPIKGKRREKTSNGMRQTKAAMHEVMGRLADRRLDAFRMEARRILSAADVVVMGEWRPAVLEGQRTTKVRNIHRAFWDAGISLMRQILEDFARRSLVPKKIVDWKETGTTETCSVCSSVTGPSGIAGIQKREWTCPTCGTHHDRNANAAVNFAKAYLKSLE